MSQDLAVECLVIEMAKAVRDFCDERDAVLRLVLADYSIADVKKHGREAVRRELLRRRLQLARAH